MPQSLAKVLLHVVFSTKNRYPWLKDVALRQELYAYMAPRCEPLNVRR